MCLQADWSAQLTCASHELDAAREDAESQRRGKESLKDLLSRSRTPPSASPLGRVHDAEVAALRESAVEMERELQQMRAKCEPLACPHALPTHALPTHALPTHALPTYAMARMRVR